MPSAETIDKHVGNRMRVRRLSLDISQQDLAAKLGLTFQQVQKYEKGANRIGASRLYQLANLLGVTVDFFFEGLEDSAEAEDPQDSMIDAFRAASPRFGAREFVDLNSAFQQIKQDGLREILLNLVEAIAEKQDGPDAAPDAEEESADESDESAS